MKKVIIIFIAGIILGALFQPFFTDGRSITTDPPPPNIILPMILFADPIYVDSDTVKAPDPAKPPPPIRIY